MLTPSLTPTFRTGASVLAASITVPEMATYVRSLQHLPVEAMPSQEKDFFFYTERHRSGKQGIFFRVFPIDDAVEITFNAVDRYSEWDLDLIRHHLIQSTSAHGELVRDICEDVTALLNLTEDAKDSAAEFHIKTEEFGGIFGQPLAPNWDQFHWRNFPWCGEFLVMAGAVIALGKGIKSRKEHAQAALDLTDDDLSIVEYYLALR